MSKARKVLYWFFTVPFVGMMLMSSFMYFTHAPMMVTTIAHLGYPIYLLTILGIFKVLGVATILYGRLVTLKEWAYAGFTIDLLGAAASHTFSGDGIDKIMAPLVFLMILLASYYFWKKIEKEKNA